MTSRRWMIRKGLPGPLTIPDRPWQLWLITDDFWNLMAERVSHAQCVQVMDTLTGQAR